MKDGQTQTLELCAMILDMKFLVSIHYTYGLTCMQLLVSVLLADSRNANTVKQSLSKPLFLRNVVCSPADRTFKECSFIKNYENMNNDKDDIVFCQKRK